MMQASITSFCINRSLVLGGKIFYLITGYDTIHTMAASTQMRALTSRVSRSFMTRRPLPATKSITTLASTASRHQDEHFSRRGYFLALSVPLALSMILYNRQQGPVRMDSFKEADKNTDYAKTVLWPRGSQCGKIAPLSCVWRSRDYCRHSPCPPRALSFAPSQNAGRITLKGGFCSDKSQIGLSVVHR